MFFALWFSKVCVHIFACVCRISLSVFLGGLVLRRAVCLTRIQNISHPLPQSPHTGFVFVQNNTYSWQHWLPMRAHLRNFPSILYSTTCTRKCRVPVEGCHFCHRRCWTGSSNHTSSVTMNELPLGFTFSQWAVHSVQIHSVHSIVSSLWVHIFT